MTRQKLSGWGRVPASTATVLPVRSPDEIDLRGIGRGALARGLGRSYGDCAQNGGGRVFDVTPLRSFNLDAFTGVAIAEGGASLGDILAAAVPAGWFLPVTPGTKHVTIGGAIAGDVHGKNHHRDGTISDHITEFDLLTADGTTMTVPSDSDAFRATAGGLGLTGVIMSATMQLLPIQTSMVAVDTQRTANLDELMAAMTSGDAAYRYSVAWIDLMATGSSMGRSVLTRGDHAPIDTLTSRGSPDPLAYRPGKTVTIPDVFPSGLLNRLSVRAFNEVWYRKAPTSRIGELQSIDEFFYPLDMLNDWNRLYGRRGFLQYQFAVPDTGAETVRTIVGDISSRGYPAFLAVLKRFGPGTGLLSFPIEGWTLALDIPIGIPGLAEELTDFDERVAEAGGRVYLAKDSRLRPDLFQAMYPEYGEWSEIRDRLDPHRVWRSDLARRLEVI
jgi:decaprenylphospho-beta-D-ribofuranose 2-oxidase